MKKAERLAPWIAFALGSIIQVASYGYFLGGLTQKVSDLKEEVNKLEVKVDSTKQLSAYAGR